MANEDATRLDELTATIPNPAHPSVPAGGEEDYEVIIVENESPHCLDDAVRDGHQALAGRHVHRGERARADDAVRGQAVTDTGIGIPAEEQTNIFDKFYRVASDDTAGRSGHGLGLPLARDIVEMHHGSMFSSQWK